MINKKFISVLMCGLIILHPTCTYAINTAKNTKNINIHAGVSAYVNELLTNADDNCDNSEDKKNKWTTTNLNIRNMPNTESDIIETLPANTEVETEIFNEEWDIIRYKSRICFINNAFLSDEELNYHIYEVPYASKKTWMSYKALTAKSSMQYRLQLKAYTGEYGIRKVDDRYCVALGSYFGAEIGQYFDLILTNGEVISCVMADQKADTHTDVHNIITVNSDCMSEFIVDVGKLEHNAKRDGNMSSIKKEWNSPVKYVRLYEKSTMLD